MSCQNTFKLQKIKKDKYNKVKAASQLAALALQKAGELVSPGITTEEIDVFCHDFILAQNGRPASLNYQGFPKSICTSINEVVCHGIPSQNRLINGDIINVDIAVELDGYYGDTSKTFEVGKIAKKTKKLLETTYETMMLGIKTASPGKTLGDIGYVMEKYALEKGYNVVKDFCGHGIGEKLHMDPIVPAYGKKNEGQILKEGMFITIEPMLNAGSDKVRILKDGWTVVTVDGSISCQFEHTIYIGANGSEILTCI